MQRLFKVAPIKNQRLNILVSYFYHDEKIQKLLDEHKDIINLIYDSGAFSAMTRKKPIKLDNYMDFIHEHKLPNQTYFTLDVVGDSKATKENYDEMIYQGFDPIPIFTRGAPFSQLDDYYKHTDYVGLGGLVGGINTPGYVKRCMRQIGRKKVHWLGFVDKNFLGYYKPYSVDSAGWTYAFRTGTYLIYLGRNEWLLFRKSKLKRRPSIELKKIFEIYGENWHDLNDMKSWVDGDDSKSLIKRIASRAFCLYSLEMEAVIKTRLYLSISTFYQIKAFVNAYTFWQSEGIIQ